MIVVLDINGYILAEVDDSIKIIAERFLSTQDVLNYDDKAIRVEWDRILKIIKRYRDNGYLIIVGYNTGTKKLSKIFIKRAHISVDNISNADVNGILEVLRKLRSEETISKNPIVKSLSIYEKILSL